MTKYVDVSPFELLEGRLLPSDKNNLNWKDQFLIAYSKYWVFMRTASSSSTAYELQTNRTTYDMASNYKQNPTVQILDALTSLN